MENSSREYCEGRDRDDPFTGQKAQFDLSGLLYFDGNSLGPLPRCSRERLRRVVEEEWGEDLIRSWNTNEWIELPRRVGARVAPLIGADEDEVIAGDSTSVALFKLAAAALQLTDRRRIVTDEANFPTDLHVLSGVAAFAGNAVELVRVPAAEIAAAIDEDTALVTLTHVDYRTARIHDMEAITAGAHGRGALALWDLSHSVGTLPLALNRLNVDLAVGCTYKYLNGGPGSPAFTFVSRRHHEKIRPVVTGWMGHARPFAFSGDHEPAPGIRRMATGTPEVLGLSAVEAGLGVFENVSMEELRGRTVEMSELFVRLIDGRCGSFGLEIASPRDPALRGGHVAVRHPEAYAVMQALIARNVIGDFRTPDIMRFGFSPLYQCFTDVYDIVDTLHGIMFTGEWQNPRYHRRAAVT